MYKHVLAVAVSIILCWIYWKSIFPTVQSQATEQTEWKQRQSRSCDTKQYILNRKPWARKKRNIHFYDKLNVILKAMNYT